ncbi:MAG: hypothetical protein R2794_08285 [Chitinophagales bacterium]
MHLQLISDHPSWFWLLCILAGVLYAGGMYYRERKIHAAISKSRVHYVLTALRFLAVFFIAVLLLDPYIRSRSQSEVKNPLSYSQVIIRQALQNPVSDSTIAMHYAQLDLQKALSNDFDIRGYAFGESLQDGYDNMNLRDHSTDLAAAVED